MATVRVKPADQAGKKWVDRAGSASGEYAAEAEAAAPQWAQKAGAAGKNYKDGVSAGGIEARFTSGVQRAGPAKYARGIREKGAGRYASGVSAGQGDYQTAVQPYLAAIASTDVPDRKLRGDPGNYERSRKIGDALKALRLARSGAGR